MAVDAIADRHLGQGIDVVVGIDARGFLFAGAVAYKLDLGLVPVRKQGKLPYDTVSTTYTFEYGEATTEIHTDAVRPGDRVLIVDDLLATGGTARAAAELVTRLGGEIAEIDFLIELSMLNGRQQLANYPVHATIVY